MRGFWADMKSSDFQNITPDAVAILPIGAIEQHGPHLPVSVDRDLVDAVAQRVMDHVEPEQNVLILPTMAIGKSNEHITHAGTLGYSAETLMRILRDIARSASIGDQTVGFLEWSWRQYCAVGCDCTGSSCGVRYARRGLFVVSICRLFRDL